MIKRIAHIILVLLFFMTTTGFNLSRHYCVGEIVAVTFTTETLPCCAEGDVNCCNIVSDRFQIETKYLLPSEELPTEKNSIVNVVEYFNTTFIIDDFQKIKRQLIINYVHPPPFGLKTILAKHQSYLL